MPEANTVEILIRARDEATSVLKQTMGQVQVAAAAASGSTQLVARGSDQAGQSVQGFARAAQRASRDVTDWAFIMGGLTPQLAVASITTLQLTNAVAEGATKMGLWTAGIGIAVAVGFKLVSMLQEARKAEDEFTAALARGDAGPIQKRIDNLGELIKRRRAILSELPEADRAEVEELNRATQGELVGQFRLTEIIKGRGEIEDARHAINRKRFEEDKALEDKRKELDEARIQGLASRIAAEGRLRVEAEHEIGQEALTAYEAFLVAKDTAARESARRQLEFNAKILGDLQRATVEAEGQISPEHGSAVSAAQFEFEERTLEGIRRAQRPIVSAMTTLGHASADALFDAMAGRGRNLGEVVKGLFEGIFRDIFRNTLAKAFGGQEQGLSLQTLLSLGGGGGPFGRVALAAGVPGAGGLAGLEGPAGAGAFPQGTAAELEGTGAGGLFTETAPIPFFGGAAMVGLGALGILGASQAQDPLSGALSGGLGGLSAGLGLASLLGVTGAFLGPIGLAAGLAFGVFSGASGRRRRKREEARRQRAEAQIALVEQADTLEELDALPVLGFEPEALAALRQRATPLILEAGREEIAGTRSLAGIRAILARGVSPDVGGADLRLEALRREQEILGGLEAIGGIGIEEQLEGGIRRTTRVGAGAFGLARARQLGGDVTVDRTAARRMGRLLLEDHNWVEEFLRQAMAVAGARGIRLEPLRL